MLVHVDGLDGEAEGIGAAWRSRQDRSATTTRAQRATCKIAMTDDWSGTIDEIADEYELTKDDDGRAVAARIFAFVRPSTSSLR